MQNYLDLMRHILANGRMGDNRTDTRAKQVFGRQLRFDLQRGFPLITTKKIHIKSVIHELLWFLKGDTNVAYLKKNKVRIWDEWRRPYTTNRRVVLIDKKSLKHVEYNGDFSSACGIKVGTIDNKLRSTWVRMMKRCYNKTQHNYAAYGGVGVSVCKRWHNCKTFISDVKKIPHWWYKKNDWNNYELDKDYFGSNQYSPDTCVWLQKGENNFYTRATTPVKMITPDGDEYVFVTLNDAARKNNIASSTLRRFVNFGMPKTLKRGNEKWDGYVFKYVDFKSRLLRLELIPDGDLGPIYGKQWRAWNSGNGETIDQIQNSIDLLQNNPDSRRIIVSAWNPADIPNMALAPCHTMFQFHTDVMTTPERVDWLVANKKQDAHEFAKKHSPRYDGDNLRQIYMENPKLVDGIGAPKRRLSCQLYQRSCDLFLGAGFNIASYALLTHMFAHVCNMAVGEFVHTFGNVHIYENHFAQCLEQLSRTPRPEPTLKIKRKVDTIDGFQFDDFDFIDYNPHPAIRAKVAV